MSLPNPTPFLGPDGVARGWKATIPGGRVFLGGGFGSHEFYALDAATGNHLWCYRTKDDVPTAAIMADDGWLMWSGSPAHNGIEVACPIAERK